MNDVGVEFAQIAADACGDGYRDSVFRTARDRDRRDTYEIAHRFEGRFLGRWRIDANVDALAEQVADQSIQRLARAVANVIVVAGEESDAKFTGR